MCCDVYETSEAIKMYLSQNISLSSGPIMEHASILHPFTLLITNTRNALYAKLDA
jgi:hypothetical protein